MACLQMILAARGDAVPPLVELGQRCTRHGGYARAGPASGYGPLIYAGFVAFVGAELGLRARVAAPLELERAARGGRGDEVVLASVSVEIRALRAARPTRRGGHLVLVIDADALPGPAVLPRPRRASAAVLARTGGVRALLRRARHRGRRCRARLTTQPSSSARRRGEEAALDGVLGQVERLLVGVAGLAIAAEAAQEVGAGGREVAVGRELRLVGERVERAQARVRAAGEADRGGAVERDDGRGPGAREQVVEGDDLAPGGRPS